jgi:hypothetical protein
MLKLPSRISPSCIARMFEVPRFAEIGTLPKRTVWR